MIKAVYLALFVLCSLSFQTKVDLKRIMSAYEKGVLIGTPCANSDKCKAVGDKICKDCKLVAVSHAPSRCKSVLLACEHSRTKLRGTIVGAIMLTRIRQYCTKLCQKTHWKVHQEHCKPLLSKEDWRPLWWSEDREPSFIGRDDNVVPHFAKELRYLWGNTPAVDILNLKDNEGASYDQNMAICFGGKSACYK